MSSIVTVAHAELRLITPLFMSGADQAVPELRAAALKSALRQWYRAADPRAVFAENKSGPRREDLYFGGAGDEKRGAAGQSPLLLRLGSSRLPQFGWSDVNVNRFTEGQGKQARNGLRYLSYSLHFRENEGRRALAPGGAATLSLVLRRRAGAEQDVVKLRRAWLSALWLLGNLGSLGTRSRRGLGSIAIVNWSNVALDEDWRADAAALPNLQRAENLQDWYAGFSKGMGSIESWFGRFEEQKYKGVRFAHPHLGKGMTLALLGAGYARWEEALNAAGRRLQDFRVRRRPDYDNVKQTLATGQPLRVAPDRAAFGLPLTFRYSSLREAGEATFVPNREGGKDRVRHASLLRIRIVKLGARYHPLFVRMAGAVPGSDPATDLLRKGRGQRDIRAELEPRAGDLLDTFMGTLSRG